MGMSTHIIGFKPPDKKWNEMKSVWDACEKAKIKIPKEVDDFFNGEPPDEAGVEIDLKSFYKVWENEYCSGFEIEINRLPKDIKIIRFYNSY